jgi:hypothetical protein
MPAGVKQLHCKKSVHCLHAVQLNERQQQSNGRHHDVILSVLSRLRDVSEDDWRMCARPCCGFNGVYVRFIETTT